jgi:hypothetical protein
MHAHTRIAPSRQICLTVRINSFGTAAVGAINCRLLGGGGVAVESTESRDKPPTKARSASKLSDTSWVVSALGVRIVVVPTADCRLYIYIYTRVPTV